MLNTERVHLCFGTHAILTVCWGTPPILVKGSRAPSESSQGHLSLFYSHWLIPGHTCTLHRWHTNSSMDRSLQLDGVWWLPEKGLVMVISGDSPAQPINNVLSHHYGVLYGPACTRPMILRSLNWSQIWTTTYLHTFGTILITFCINFYLTKLITRTISDHVHILSH